MSRKSRIKKADSTASLSSLRYNTAFYVRVSVIDGGKKDSDTVGNQELLLQHFIAAKPEFVLAGVYIDNGESGVNFNRSEFERLLWDVKAGKINCIIVKDLSRFGRNYIETGEYLEQIFPLLGVRFIAINDNYDNLNPNAADIMSVHLHNLVNDVYARDISRKICPVIQVKQERGEFIGTWAPYGYRLKEGNRKQLVPDEETAPIVRHIFGWRGQEWTYRNIVHELLVRGIPSPSQYRYNKGIIKNRTLAGAMWKSTTVMRILSNQVYIGHMVQGKKRAALWNNQMQTVLPEEDWILVPDTHEPIIEAELFRAVQEINNRTSAHRKARLGRFTHVPDREAVLRGLVYCGECGAKLIRNKTVKERKDDISIRYYTVCPVHRAAPAKCSFTGMKEEDLITAVYQAVKIQYIIAAALNNPFDNQQTLNRLIAVSLVESITVYNKTSIIVRFHFEDELKKWQPHIASPTKEMADG